MIVKKGKYGLDKGGVSIRGNIEMYFRSKRYRVEFWWLGKMEIKS